MQDDQLDAPVAPAAPGRVLHSDPHDFAGLYIRHRASFTLHARRYLRDARDADEVVQEAFLRLFLALPELETELQALAYCRRTITNLCIDRYRAQARRPHLVDLDSVPADDLAEDDPGDPVVRAEDAAVVREALSLLSPLHRAALVKREIEEKTLPVIAEELDIPEESVKHVLFRARRALRRVLANTSVAPTVVAQAVRKGGTGLAAFVALLAVGLGTGPDLQAIPVVGDDLPDLPGITEIARDLYEVITGTSDGADPGGGARVDGGDGGAPLVLVPASPSPSSSASPAPATVTVDIVRPSALPSPSALPTPSASPVPSAVPTTAAPVPSRPSPTNGPTGEPSGPPSPEVSEPAAEPVPDEPAPEASPSRAPKRRPSASPSASPSTAPPADPESYQTDGIEWVVDPDSGDLVLVPEGSTDLYG